MRLKPRWRVRSMQFKCMVDTVMPPIPESSAPCGTPWGDGSTPEPRKSYATSFHMSSDFEIATNPVIPMSSYRTLNTFLTEAAVRWPDHPALIEGGATLTWAGLNQASARVASALLRRGARPGDRVAVCGPKTSRIIAAIHGVLKAGCVCVPIDPASPAVRAQAVLEDCDPVAIIGSAEALPNLRVSSSRVRISIDQGVEEALSWQEVMVGELVPLTAAVQLSDLAYLLYTSGSTGQPKGVMLSHENVS